MSGPITAAPLLPVKPVAQRRFGRFVISRASSPCSPTAAASRSARELTWPAPVAREDLEPLAVTVNALPGHARDAQVGQNRVAAPLLALFHGGQVHLDRGQPGDLQRVADRVGVVRPGAGVQQQRVGRLAACAGTRRTRPRGWSGRRSPSGPGRARSARSPPPAQQALSPGSARAGGDPADRG